MKKTSILLLLAVVITSTLLLLNSCKNESVEFMIGNDVYHTSKIKKDSVADMPDDPTRDDMYFLGWFTEDGMWNGTATNGLKIYASWLSLEAGEDGNYTVTGVSERHPNVISIPNEYKGHAITSVADKAFFANATITQINIPSSVTSIGASAFSECPKLSEISVGEESDSYKDINGDLYTKDGTTLLQYAIGKSDTTVTLPDELTAIASHAFSRALSITSITIPVGVADIPDYAFYGCTALGKITFADGAQVASIGDCAFSNCSSLSEVTVPKSVTSIGEWSFYSCTSLKKISFERRTVLEEVNDYAFAMTPNLEVILYDGSYRKWNDLVKINKETNEIDHLIRDYDSAGYYLVPEGAWVPTDEYAGITYGVWLTEDDYLAGLAPTKWYTSEELLTEHIGTMDTNGKEYSDPEFIPGYAHLYADLSNLKGQLVTGHNQKLKLNLGGHTLTMSKGLRVGGNDASHPEASLTIMYGTVDFIAGQIQARRDSSFIIENTVFICQNQSADLFYGACSDLIHFKNSELTVTSGATFMMTYNTLAGEARSKLIFERTDIIYTDVAAKDSIFRIIQGRAGETAWDIIFDKESSIRGDIKSLVTLKDTYYNGIFYPINNHHTVTIEVGCSILTGVEKYDTYVMCTYDPTTGDAFAPATCPAGDQRLAILYETITSID